jgi:K+-transporting ATPase ATPase C chain
MELGKPVFQFPLPAVQIKRVSDFRGLNEAIVAALVEKNTEQPLMGLFGSPVVNVLTLNLALSYIH